MEPTTRRYSLWTVVLIMTVQHSMQYCPQPKFSLCGKCVTYEVNKVCGNGEFSISQPYCYRKSTYHLDGTVTIEKGFASEAECRANTALSSISNPACRQAHASPGTVCYDCCISYNCRPEEELCNENFPVNTSDIVFGGKPGVVTNAPTTLPTTPTTTTPTTTTTTPTTTTTTPTTTTTTPTTTTTTPTTTTTTPTTTTTTPTTTTTTPTTTTPTTTTTTPTTTTTTTPTTTTTTPPTTTPKIPPSTSAAIQIGSKCQVCSKSKSESCYLDQEQYCPASKPLCMNTIMFSEDGSRSVEKTCETDTRCYWSYWIGQQNDPVCRNISNGVNITKNVCHYCCKTQPGRLSCNVPDIALNTPVIYTTTTTSTRNTCVVGDKYAGYTYSNCTTDKPYCLNEIYYEQGNIVEVNKRCASKTTCIGEWWNKSRKTYACASGDVSNFTASGQNLVCDICCLSDGTGACNLKHRPDEIYRFKIETTPAPVSTVHAISNTSPHLSSPASRQPLTSTVPASITHAPSSTQRVTTPQPISTSTQSSTTTRSTTQAQLAHSCHVCGHEDLGIPCLVRETSSNHAIRPCAPGHNYCMSTVIGDNNRNLRVFKRCVTEDVCRSLWLLQSSDQSLCLDYDGNSVLIGTCYYCCTTANCNTNIKPPGNFYVGKH